MAQAFYTLEESAQILQISADALKQMIRKQQIRAFQDRGTWRFRVQDIQELARQRGIGSDPELIIGQPPPPPAPPTPGPRTPASKRGAEVFDFSLDLDEEHVGIGHEDLRTGSHPSKRKSGLSPAPKAGSDSDVRLVTDNELEALSKKKKGSDSEVKLVHQDPPSSRSKLGGPKSSKVNLGGPPSSGPRSPKSGPPPSSKSGPPPSSKSGPHSPRPGQPGSSRRGVEPLDSGVRLVPLGSDSDVKIVGVSADDIGLGHQPPLSATDSDIRLQQSGKMPPPDSAEGMLTEEIDLDHELQGGAGPHTPSSKMRARPSNLDATTPFALSDPNKPVPPAAPSSGKGSLTDSSGDFELTPAAESSSPVETGSSDEFTLDTSDEDVGLGELPPAEEGDPASGINLVHPADGGISLEEGSNDAVDFELSLDEVQHTPRPASSPSHKDSEFELSLDEDSDAGEAGSSEFELTLDDSGGLAPLEDEPAAGEEKDIFETDFEVPALDDESGSQALALDESAEAELESSDFDLTLGEEEGAVDEESGSQVVALEDEGELGEGEEPAFDQFEAEGEEGAEEAAVSEKALPTAPWGVLPVAVMLPCVIVLFLVSVMGFELVQSVAAHKPPGMLTKAIGGMLGQNLKQ
jgi:Helix-turn-helix domain